MEDVQSGRLAEKAALGRVNAINSAKGLHWVVDAGDLSLSFDQLPTMREVVEAAERQGFDGLVRIRSMTAKRKVHRPLMLTPMQRVRSLTLVVPAAE